MAIPQFAANRGDRNPGCMLMLGTTLVVTVLNHLEPEEPKNNQEDPEQHGAQNPGQSAHSQFLSLGPPQETTGWR